MSVNKYFNYMYSIENQVLYISHNSNIKKDPVFSIDSKGKYLFNVVNAEDIIVEIDRVVIWHFEDESEEDDDEHKIPDEIPTILKLGEHYTKIVEVGFTPQGSRQEQEITFIETKQRVCKMIKQTLLNQVLSFPKRTNKCYFYSSELAENTKLSQYASEHKVLAHTVQVEENLLNIFDDVNNPTDFFTIYLVSEDSSDLDEAEAEEDLIYTDIIQLTIENDELVQTSITKL